jgi:HAD superfamily hydrolase (TIGR01509 family)
MTARQKAFILDLNGTMIDDMQYHAKAWYEILNDELQAGLSMGEVKKQMYGKNEEVLQRIFGKNYFTDDEMKALSLEKERRYQKIYAAYLELVKGLPEFLEQCKKHNILLAIGTAAIPFNIDFTLDRLHIRHYFSTIVGADDVTASKPDPETFTKAAQLLRVKANNCIVFEDAPKGVEAAMNAGMQSVVITTMHAEKEFTQYNNILFFIKDYTDDRLEELFATIP